MAAADTARLVAELTLDDKFTKPLNRIDKRLGAFSGAVNRNLGRGIDTAVSRVGRAVVDITKGIAGAAIDWEDAFQGVVKTVDTTPEKLAEIGTAIREMATEMPVAASQLAAIAEMGGAMGIEAAGIEEFTRQVAILGSTTNLSFEDAAAGLGQLQNTIGLTADEFDNFSAALVELGNEGSSVETTILEIARRMGASATAFGISKDAILGWAAAAANLGLEADAAGGALQRVFTKLQLKIADGSKSVSKIMGRSAKDIRKLFAKDATRALELFIRKLAKIPPAKRLQAIVDVFGKDQNIIRTIAGMTNEIEKTGKALDDGTRAWHENAAAQEEFDKRNATVRSAITRLRNGLTEAAITVGEGFVPALGRAADKLAKFLKIPANRTALQNIGRDIGKLIDGIDWDALLGYARSFMGALDKASGFAKALWDAFSSIPSDAKAVLISLAGLNKLSGGAVTGIMGDIFKGLGDQFFARGSSPANPMWVQQVGGGKGGSKDTPGTTGKGGKPTSGSRTPAETTRTASSRIKDAAKGGILITAAAVTLRGDTVKGAPGGAMSDKALLADLRKMLGQGRGGENVGGGRTVVQAIDALTKKLGVSTAGTDPSDPRHENRRKMDQVKAAIDASKADTIAENIATRNALVSKEIELKGAVNLGAGRTSNAATGAGSRVTTQSIGNTSRIVGAIGAIPAPQTYVDVDVNVSAAQVTTSQTTRTRSSGSSSRTDDTGQRGGWGGP